MKNLFKIHWLTYLILISVLLAGYFNYFLIISIILFFHELGHIILIKLFGCQIKKIEILPFGCIINTNIGPNTNSIKILLISLGGVMAQLFLFLIMPNFLSSINYPIFMTYNSLLIWFNLLPIIPLDGSKILASIFESFISYKKAMIIQNIISSLAIIILIIYITFHALNVYLIISFLIYKTYEQIKNHTHLFNYFLLDRHLNKYNFKKIKHISLIKHIYKNRFNFIKGENEDRVLSSYFN